MSCVTKTFWDDNAMTKLTVGTTAFWKVDVTTKLRASTTAFGAVDAMAKLSVCPTPEKMQSTFYKEDISLLLSPLSALTTLTILATPATIRTDHALYRLYYQFLLARLRPIYILFLHPQALYFVVSYPRLSYILSCFILRWPRLLYLRSFTLVHTYSSCIPRHTAAREEPSWLPSPLYPLYIYISNT